MFMAFFVQIYAAFLTMQGFFRTFGLMCTNFDVAFRLATFFVPNMIMYTGYMIPVFEMKRWLFWIVSVLIQFLCIFLIFSSPYSTTSTLWHMVSIFRGFNPSRIKLYVPLAFSGCIENEFMRINLECDGAYVVPRNGPGMTKYP